MLAALMGISRREAMGLLMDFWAWALELGPSDEPPTGELLSPKAEVMMAGALEWTGSPSELADALVDAQVLERIEGGFRARGLDRYRRAWEKNRRRGHGKDKGDSEPPTPLPKPPPGVYPAETRQKPGNMLPGKRAHPAEQTQTQTQTHKKGEKAAADAPPPGALRDSLEAGFKQTRGHAYLWTSADENELRAVALEADSEILRRWDNALRRTVYPRCDTVRDLVRHWNAYATDQPSSPPKYGPPGATSPPRRMLADKPLTPEQLAVMDLEAAHG